MSRRISCVNRLALPGHRRLAARNGSWRRPVPDRRESSVACFHPRYQVLTRQTYWVMYVNYSKGT